MTSYFVSGEGFQKNNLKKVRISEKRLLNCFYQNDKGADKLKANIVSPNININLESYNDSFWTQFPGKSKLNWWLKCYFGAANFTHEWLKANFTHETKRTLRMILRCKLYTRFEKRVLSSHQRKLNELKTGIVFYWNFISILVIKLNVLCKLNFF